MGRLTASGAEPYDRARGRLRRSLQLAGLTVSLLAPSAPAIGRAADTAPEGSLAGTLRQIETAFLRGDAAALASACSERAKVRLDLRAAPRSTGSYRGGQVVVIFASVFRSFRTTVFEFPRDAVREPREDTAFARARWRRQARRGPEMDEALTFTLHREPSGWRVHEILSSTPP
jgi:hypothetical protein